MRVVTLKKVQATMRLLAHRISRLTLRETRLGKPISYGVFSVPAPNTDLRRTPNPFSGGN